MPRHPPSDDASIEKVLAQFRWDPPAGPCSPNSADSVVDTFLQLACLNYGDWNRSRAERARQLLAEHPEISRASLHAAATVGDVAAVREMLEREPMLASKRGGALRWEPLLYAAYSRLDSTAAGHSTLEVARLLLQHGADPNAGFLWGGNVPPFTALTGAFGEGEDGRNQPPHRDCEALARLLLEAGADPNDGQTLYNRHFNPDDGHLRLLFEYGLGEDRGGPWFERLGARMPDPGRMLVEELWSAAKRNRLARVELLIEHGVDVNGRGFRDGRTAYESAILGGNPEIAEVLVRHGARRTELSPEETFVAACVAGDRVQALTLCAKDPGLVDKLGAERRAGLLSTAIGGEKSAGVRLMAELGFDLDAMKGGRTALHDAAWGGDLAMIELLLELGADPDIRDPNYRATPLGWAAHNQQLGAVERLMPSADLFDALRCDGVERVRALLDREPALVNRADAAGNPIGFSFHAGMRRGPDLLELLVSRGADLNARNKQGETALDQALSNGDTDLADLLRRNGAKTSAEGTR